LPREGALQGETQALLQVLENKEKKACLSVDVARID
jgi:hypothetical protein